MRTHIKGASAAQGALLRDLLAGMATERIRKITLRPYEPTFEEDEEFGLEPPPGPYGTSITFDYQHPDSRAAWEARVIANVFVRRSAEAGLSPTTYFSEPESGHTLKGSRSPMPALSADHLDEIARAGEQKRGSANLEKLEVLRPSGYAFAFRLRVDEPHAYLRYGLTTFLEAIARWRERCEGIYTEVRDANPRPVFVAGWYERGGLSETRQDVECCAPFLGISRPLVWQPPTCPVYDRVDAPA